MSSSEVTLIAGDNGVNVNGDNNVLNLYQQPIKYELLSKLCRDLIGSNLSLTEDMNISQLPIELLKKIEFNNLKVHKELYEDLGMYLADIDDIVNKSLGNKSIITPVKSDLNSITSFFISPTVGSMIRTNFSVISYTTTK